MEEEADQEEAEEDLEVVTEGAVVEEGEMEVVLEV